MDDSFFNIKAGEKDTPGNLTVNLAGLLLQMKNNSFEIFSKLLVKWLFPAIDLPGGSAARERSCKLLHNIHPSIPTRNAWTEFLKNVVPTADQQPSNMLFSFVVTQFYEKSLSWKNSVLIDSGEIIDLDI